MAFFDDLKNTYLNILKPVQQTLGNVGQQVQQFTQPARDLANRGGLVGQAVNQVRQLPQQVRAIPQIPQVKQYFNQVQANKQQPFFNNTGNNPRQWLGKVAQDFKQRGPFEAAQDLTYPILQNPYISPLVEPRIGDARVANFKAGRPNPLINSLLGQTDSQMSDGLKRDFKMPPLVGGIAGQALQNIKQNIQQPQRILQNPALKGFQPNASFEDTFNAAMTFQGGNPSNVTRALIKNPKLEPAVKALRNQITREDVNILGKFAEQVQKNPRAPLDYTGQQVASFAKRLFGKDAETWSNQKLVKNIDYVLNRIGQGKNPAGLGLSTTDVSKGLGKGKNLIPSGLEGGGGKSVIEEIKGGFAGGRQARESVENITKGSFVQRAKTELLDRLTPVYEFVNKGAKNLTTEQNPYRQMRLLAGLSGKVEAFVTKNVVPILKAEKGRQGDLSALWTLEREQELIGRGLTRKRNAQQIAQGIEELKAKYGEEGFRTLQESSVKLRNVGNGLLDMLHQAGVIGDDSFNAIKSKNQFYAPMEAVEHIADNLEKGAYGSGNSFNVASQNVVKRIKSYTGDVSDPIETLVRRIPKVLALVEKNKAMQSLVNLKNQFPDVYKDLIVPMKAEVTSPGMKTINLFENGKNVSYAVPEVVANAIKGLDAETAGILVNLGSWQAKILRSGATALNIGFIPVNIIRDVQDALTTELSEKGVKAMFQFLGSYPAAIFSAAGKGKLYQEWAAAGGLQSTMTEQLLKRTPKTVAQLSGKGQGIFKSVIGSPRSLIEFANRVGEQSTRLARFKSGVSRGENVMEAAFKSRDISLDFAKAGNSTKILNQVIPFLNAGIQGSEKVLRLYKNNPKAALAVTGALFGIPTVSLYTHNSQFNDFNDIPEAEKQRNWLLIARDRTPEEIAAGEKVIGIKIAKGFLARITTNTIESALDFMKQKDPSSFMTSMLGIAEGFSPVGLPYDKESLGRSVSQVTPPGARAAIEGLTNTNLYFGSPIVPQGLQRLPATEQYRENTPSIYKNVGALTGTSPLMLENTVNTTTGGLGRQLATLFSGDIKGATTDQITRRFSGIQGGKQADLAYETVGKEKEYTALRNKRLREAFASGNEEEFNKLIEGMTAAQVKSIINYSQDQEINKQLTPEQRAYETLTKEEKLRLGEKQPDLRSKVQFGGNAYAASTLGGPNYDLSGNPKGSTTSTYMTDFKSKQQEEMVKTKVEISGKPQTYNGKYYYLNENGNATSVELDKKLTEPKLTGNAEVDKIKLQKYASEFTSKINDLIKLNDLGQLSDSELINKVTELKAQQKAVQNKYAKPKKPKKAKKIVVPKMPKLKTVKPFKVKVVKPKKIKVYKVKKTRKLSTKVKKIRLT